MSLTDFYRTGKQDCANTFDSASSDWDVEQLANLTNRAWRSGQSWADVARRVARRALEKSKDWVSQKDWLRGIDYDPDEDGPITEAYAAWKRGYIDCATPRLAEWILKELDPGASHARG
jgi:hypothetical protein